ncbi:MAG TPA: hypothetical protein VMU84_12460, partial [Thermoanaerobaculia bacterium]|nr:hypothetical protein [Thermoanaerobaculia bacterium]
IDIEVGANAKFEVTLTDDFVLVFWRDTAGQLHTGVKKASSRGTAATLGFGVTAKFSDPDAATKAATDFLEGYLTKPLDAVNAIIAKAGNVQLSDDEKKVLKALGIDPDSANAGDAAKKALDDLQKKLETKIKTVAELEIGASWKYEYSRVESSKFIVEAPITDTQLTALHPSLVAQNVQPLLDDSSIVLTKYLDETTVVRKRSFGFSLGIGKWFTIGDQDQSELTVRTRHSRDKSRSMISYVGARKFGGDGVWKIKPLAFDFRAEMSEYVADPKTSNFDYGITLSMEMTEQTLNEDVIATLLDNASLWSIVADDDADDVREKLSSIEGKATARFELTFDKATLGLIAPIAGHRNPLVMGRALAAAMPWSTDAARRAWKIRRTLYAPAWAAVLNGKDSQTAYAFVKDAVKAVDFAMSERDGKLDQLFNLRRLIEVHPDIAAHYTKWSNGMASLAQAIAPGSLPHTENANIFRNLYDYFSQVLYARAIGNALTQITSANVGRAATVTYKDADGKEQTLAIGSKA